MIGHCLHLCLIPCDYIFRAFPFCYCSLGTKLLKTRKEGSGKLGGIKVYTVRIAETSIAGYSLELLKLP